MGQKEGQHCVILIVKRAGGEELPEKEKEHKASRMSQSPWAIGPSRFVTEN